MLSIWGYIGENGFFKRGIRGRWSQSYSQKDCGAFILMLIKNVNAEDRKIYLDLLLVGDEQEDMIEKYIYKGEMYVLDDDGIKAECVIMDVGDKILEIKNIAVRPAFQGKGYGRSLIEFLAAKYY
ncbi:MAG: GNAT family N-acetyltransferase [Desulfovibrio sp.]|nr:GNAT family N-acetyltransferase [Desulfovibrio sp.]